jgi:hypothetical protein
VIPPEETVIVTEPEICGARAWAERHGILLSWVPENLELRAVLKQANTGDEYYLRGRFRDYRAIAPEWTFSDVAWNQTGRHTDFPNPISTPFGASIFIKFGNPALSIPQHAIICSPFNRLAYTDGSGPHGDWGGPSRWMEISKTPQTPGQGNGHVRAETIGDMLQIILRDFSCTTGRMVFP